MDHFPNLLNFFICDFNGFTYKLGILQSKILWVNICAQDLEGVAISINKWWKTRYLGYKIRIVSKKEFKLVKMQAEKKEQ